MSEYDEVLTSIQRSLEKIHKSIETIAEQNNTAQRDKKINAHIDSKVDVGLPIEVSEYYRSEQGERRPKNRRDRIRLILEIVGVVTAVILAGLTLKTFLVLRGQLQQMRTQTTVLQNQATQAAQDAIKTRGQTDQQLKLVQDQFTIDQRPYMVVEGIPSFPPGPGPLASGREIMANISFKNIGRTPAMKVSHPVAFIRYQPTKNIADLFSFLKNVSTDLDKTEAAYEAATYADLRRIDVAPNATTFTTVILATTTPPYFNNSVLSNTEVAAITNGNLALYSLGIIKYTDEANRNYETRFCFYFVGSDTAVWHLCDAYNTIK